MNPRLAVLAITLAMSALAAKKPVAPIEYPNFRVVPTSCDVAWATAVRVVTNAGFIPQSSDKTGGVLSLKWGKGDIGYPQATREVKAYTKTKPGALTTYMQLRIEPSSMLFAAEGQGCRVQMNIPYSGYRQGMTGKGFVMLESNGRLESEALAKIAEELK